MTAKRFRLLAEPSLEACANQLLQLVGAQLVILYEKGAPLLEGSEMPKDRSPEMTKVLNRIMTFDQCEKAIHGIGIPRLGRMGIGLNKILDAIGDLVQRLQRFIVANDHLVKGLHPLRRKNAIAPLVCSQQQGLYGIGNDPFRGIADPTVMAGEQLELFSNVILATKGKRDLDQKIDMVRQLLPKRLLAGYFAVMFRGSVGHAQFCFPA